MFRNTTTRNSRSAYWDKNKQPIKIGDIKTCMKIWKPLTFKVLYKFPFPKKRNGTEGENQRKPVMQCLVGDETGIITLLYVMQTDEEYNCFKVNKVYTVLAGGACSRAPSKFKNLMTEAGNLILWLNDVLNNVMAEIPQPPMEVKKLPLRFEFKKLKDIAAKCGCDILAKIVEEEEGAKHDPDGVKTTALVDSSIPGKEFKCRLLGDHSKLPLPKGSVVALYNAYVGTEGKDVIILVTHTSAVFLVSDPEWAWVLNQTGVEEVQQLLNVVTPVKGLKRCVESQKDSSLSNESSSDHSDLEGPKPKLRRENFPEIRNVSSISQLKEEMKITENSSKQKAWIDFVLTRVEVVPVYTIRRYLGCVYCTKSLLVENEDYVCIGQQCVKFGRDKIRNKDSDRKSCFLVKNFVIRDGVDTFESSLTVFNKEIEDFLGKSGDEFETDSDAKALFDSLVRDRPLMINLRATLNKIGSQPDGYPWKIDVKRIENDPAEKEHTSQNDAGCVVQSSSKEDEEDVRKFLAERKMFNIEIVKSSAVIPVKEAEEYIHTRRPMGLAVHIFTTTCRKGAEYDDTTFKALFEQLHYEVYSFSNIKREELAKVINNCRERLVQKKHESLILCISSHGLSNTIVLESEEEKEEECADLVNIWTDIIYQFDDHHFPKFKGHPKIVLINSCQSFPDRAAEISDKIASPMRSFPSNPDFLVFIATSPGFQAFRDVNIGTHFMRTLAFVFMKYASTTEIRGLFSIVQRLLHNPYETANQTPMLPEIRDFMFSKLFFFRP